MVARACVAKPAGAAVGAAPAAAGRALGRSLLTVQLKHSCLATACSNTACTICVNSSLRACTAVLKSKYVAGSPLQAPCGAWPSAELLCSKPGALSSTKYELQVHLIDDVKYQSLRLAGAPPTRDQLGSCLASDAGLSYQGTDQTTIALPIVDGEASLTDLYIYKVPGGRSGHSTFYRLLFTLTTPDNNENNPNSGARVHAELIDGPTAAPLLTDKLQLITTRSKCNEKSEALYADQSVKKVQAVGDGFAKILSELKVHVPEVPDDLASVTKVGDFQQLVHWVKRTSNTAVPNLFRPNDWTKSSKHVLSALLQDDTRERLWFPSASGAGLLFSCQQGEVQLDSPASFVLMREESLVMRPLSQLGSGQLSDLVQKAEDDWYAAGHPNWSVYEVGQPGQTRQVPVEVASCDKAATSASVAAKPGVVLAKAALGAAFGSALGFAKRRPVRRSAAAPSSSAGCATATGLASSVPLAQAADDVAATASPEPADIAAASAASGAGRASRQTTADLTGSPSCSSASSGEAVGMPALSLTNAELPATAAAVFSVAASPSAASAVTGKRQQQPECVEQQPPHKKLCVGPADAAAARMLVVSAFPARASDEAPGEAVAAVEAATEPLHSEIQQAASGSLEQQMQMCGLQSQEAADREEGGCSEADEFLQLLCNGVSGDWSNDLEADLTTDMDTELDSDSSLLRDLMLQQQQQQPVKASQQDAEVLQMLYQSMSEDWCSELDAELGNNLGSSFFYELDVVVPAPQPQLQQVACCGSDELMIDEGLMSRLVSLSDLPDFSELCDALCI